MGKADIPISDSFEVHVVDAILNELFASIGEILVFHPLTKGFVELSFDGCYLGSCAVGWNDSGITQKDGIGKGWSVDGSGSAIFRCSENGAQIAVCSTTEGAWHSGEVSFEGCFDIVEYFVVRSSCMFDDFVWKSYQKIVDLVDCGCHVCCCLTVGSRNCSQKEGERN